MSRYYFAWSDEPSGAVEFNPTVHARNDESVFSFSLEQNEGDFAVLRVTLRNPKVGLLHAGRKRWAWFSREDDLGVVVPLFFGRLIGLPQALGGELIDVEFIAKGPDADNQKAELADSLRVLPYYDPVFLPETERVNPDKVLDGRAELWDVNRVTLEWSTTNVLAGEDGTLAFSPESVIYDSVGVTVGQSPASRVEVAASVKWTAEGNGVLDVTRDVCRACAAKTLDLSGYVGSAYFGQNYNASVQVNLLGAQGMIDAWPKPGLGVGGGWSVGRAAADFVGMTPAGDIITGITEPTESEVEAADEIQGRGILVETLRGGFYGTGIGIVEGIADAEYIWLPMQTIHPFLELEWSARREYSETVTLAVTASLQQLVTDNPSGEVVALNFAENDVGVEIDGTVPIGDVRRRSYYRTARGLQSIEYLICVARANLLYRSRAVEVEFKARLDSALLLTCRKNASLTDDRLPGGYAVGKVTAYTFELDGESGEELATVRIGCAIGKAEVLTTSAGEPVYAESDLDSLAYQGASGTTALVGGDVLYSPAAVTLAAINDDGVDLSAVGPEYVRSIGVTGGYDTQRAEATTTWAYRTAKHVVDRISAVKTKISIVLVPVEGGPFTTVYNITTSELSVPKMIDLES